MNIFDIQRFSWHDGPGIRTVVFLKGCNMECFWCQNPESHSSKTDIFYFGERCIHCGRCAGTCPRGCHLYTEDKMHVFEREKCTKCGACVEECYAEALTVAGKTATVGSIMEEILKDREFYAMSNGGVTLSGGEPLLQAGECRELLLRCRERNISTAVDTAGDVEWSVFEQVLPVTDYILFDVKAIDDNVHKQACGVSNRRVLENLKRLKNYRVKIIIRTPVIPGVNDNMGEIQSVLDLVRGFENLEKIELLPYHTMGRSKYRALGRIYRADGLPVFGPRKMKQLNKLIHEKTACDIS
jgi:pyruvate formate lyase activating enzyme